MKCYRPLGKLKVLCEVLGLVNITQLPLCVNLHQTGAWSELTLMKSGLSELNTEGVTLLCFLRESHVLNGADQSLLNLVCKSVLCMGHICCWFCNYRLNVKRAIIRLLPVGAVHLLLFCFLQVFAWLLVCPQMSKMFIFVSLPYQCMYDSWTY